MSQTTLGQASELQANSPALVLVADAYEDMRVMLRTLLELSGLCVAEAGTGSEASASAAHQRPDLILLDWHLVKLDGPGFLQRLHADLQGVPIVVLSDYIGDHYREAALVAGCADYLTKPINLDAFYDMLECHFSGGRFVRLRITAEASRQSEQ